MRAITTEIAIAAPPEVVWQVLTDFPGHAAWNPYVRTWTGEARVGTRMHLVAMPGDPPKPMQFRPRVEAVREGRELRYVHVLGTRWFFSAEHVCELVPRDGGTLFRQHEEFRGLLLPFIWKLLDRDARAGFEAMNRALRDTAEARLAAVTRA